MKEHYVTYDQAVKLKELGFDWSVNRYYNESDNPSERLLGGSSLYLYSYNTHFGKDGGVCSAPRLDQAQAWLRDCKDTIVIAEPYWECEIEDDSDYLTGKWCFVVWQDGCYILCNFDPNKEGKELWLFDTYELALSAGIDKALELLTDKS